MVSTSLRSIDHNIFGGVVSKHMSIFWLQLDSDGLHDLNVQALWESKGGSYWLRYSQCRILSEEELTIGQPDTVQFKIGDKVRVKNSVTTPK